MNIKNIMLIAFAMIAIVSFAQENRNIVLPKPSKVSFTAGTCSLTSNSSVHIKEKNAPESTQYLIAEIKNRFGIETKAKASRNSLVINLNNTNSDRSSEAYNLEITTGSITINSDSEKGIFYGIQSLLQLIDYSSTNGTPIDCQIIDDKPRFGWRAFMLDESRHFKGEKEVIRLLDVMAELKMNIFHWHLTDDQGWRFESKKYPLLTTIGGKRKDTQVGGWNSTQRAGVPHEGFYTQEQIRRIVKYANDRHIKVVPEIEMPGHASAAIAAYPWLGSSDEKVEVPAHFGKHYPTYNVTDPKVMEFLQDITAEAIELFNTDVIHVGGDEVRFDHWEQNPQIRKYKEEKGFSSFMDIQIEAVNTMSRFIAGKGASMMGWNEILGKNLHNDDNISFSDPSQKIASNVIVQFWKGDLGEMASAAKEGYRLVNSYHASTYLDYDYKSIPLMKAYMFNPIPEGLPNEFQKNIYGSGCQMWSEWIPTVELMHRQIFPRIGAYAEVGWSAQEKDFEDFARRLKITNSRWEKMGIKGFPIEELIKK
jgi:hexosaminidase